VEQIHRSDRLRGLNHALKLHRMIIGTVQEANRAISKELDVEQDVLNDLLTCFVSWDIKANHPLMMVDFSNSYLTSVWMA